jgi:hypothetical protein
MDSAHIKDGQEKTVISSGVKIPVGESKLLLMVAEQERRDKIRARLIRKIQHKHDLEAGLIDTGNFWAVAGDE